MTRLKDDLLAEIEKGLRAGWMRGQERKINEEVSKMIGDDLATSSARSKKRTRLQTEASSAFSTYWHDALEKEIVQQYDGLHQEIRMALLRRHAWLEAEEPSTETRVSLLDLFLSRALKELLFNLLQKTPNTANSWEKLVVDNSTHFSWQPINQEDLNKQIQSYPLSDASFYDDRSLPSYLTSPFTTQPMRYDLYRLLKKTYGDKFKPQMVDGVFCTKIAPFHYSELPTRFGVHEVRGQALFFAF